MAHYPDVAIFGGGIIGLTCAYYLAHEGVAVAVYDRGALGQEASWAGAGIVPPGNPARAASPLDQLRGLGAEQFPRLSAELRELTGLDNGYRRCGAIEFLSAAEAEVPNLWAAEGIAFERLSVTAARQLEPLGEIPGEPYLLPDCAQVRNPWHLRALIAACQRRGVKLYPHTTIRDDWFTRPNRIAARYVIAAGAWTNDIVGRLWQLPDLHPVRGQIALLRGASCSRIVMVGKRYLVPRGDGLTLVGSTEEPEAGFVKETTSDAIAALVRFAQQLVPVLQQATLERAWAGLRPASGDGVPYIGPVPGWPAVVVATGHFRAGVQLSIGTAQVVSDMLLERPPRIAVEAFALTRAPQPPRLSAFRS
ncbi:MAG: FAD-dependent oxidoreductase [Gemmataceae bacterium]|nr:FAD-dependent oxidoreductase [Gemmata sp.]MDW8197458.1 FAD-dependent oxidoreductase [Gemmataceae bacterium]